MSKYHAHYLSFTTLLLSMILQVHTHLKYLQSSLSFLDIKDIQYEFFFTLRI